MSSIKDRGRPSVRENELKWTKDVWDAGWTAIPNTILTHQHELKIDPVEFNILMQIAKHCWYQGRQPYPAKWSIAETIKRSPRTVQRHLAKLEKKGYIKRVHRFTGNGGGQTSNEYDLSGLIAAATPHAETDLRKKRSRRSEGEYAKKSAEAGS